jgi:hypothetical protein
VHFIGGLMAHKTPFLVADLGPDVEPFLLHLCAALAEKKRAVISQRTKAALAAAKGRGQVLGNPRLADARAVAHAALKAEASAHADSVMPAIRGAKSLRRIAALSMDAAAPRRGEVSGRPRRCVISSGACRRASLSRRWAKSRMCKAC